ncbi:MAG: hypothetical protein JXA61_07030 [Bacteroidales bacterium]|nr:hypothetical protein [Bacteroidales bacterium]
MAQNITGLLLVSGIEYRSVCWIFMILIVVGFLPLIPTMTMEIRGF